MPAAALTVGTKTVWRASWMGFFSLTMLRIALQLARENLVYQDLATKFFEHFLAIATAVSQGFGGKGLWDEDVKSQVCEKVTIL
jgi:hypothetical protein